MEEIKIELEENNSTEKRILSNKIRTPDGTILESMNVHDYVTYKDKNGQYYSCDGGTQYLKRAFDIPDYDELSVYDDQNHDTRRQNLRWGVNYDKDMSRLPNGTEWRLIKDLVTDHIQAILSGGYANNNSFYKGVFEEELKFRKNGE